jgi:23S rRNA pseudouridine2605 synthase
MSDTEPKGERIAKVMARAGIASRRDAEKMILDGRVAVNGVKAASPALDVLPSDKVTLDGKPIDAPQPARLWLYYKPVGLVTSARDEKGRQTVFDTMPKGMPRVMSVGRLDLTSEGLLLLTNDGELKRKLELPSTGWLRKYRVRVNGRPNEATFDPLRRGVEIDGEAFQPMEVTLDKQQGANAWLTVGLREGRNREVRRAMTEVGLIVNRLIRVSYGPFRLNKMKPGDVVEVKQKTLREQLGDPRGESDDESPARARKPRQGGAAKAEGRGLPHAPRARPEGDRKAPAAVKKSFGKRPEGDARSERGGKAFDRKEGFAKRPPRDGTDTHDLAGHRGPPRGKPRSAAAGTQIDKPRWAVGKERADEDRPRPARARAGEGTEGGKFGGKPGGGKRFGGKPEGKAGDAPRPYRAGAAVGGDARRASGTTSEGGKRSGGKEGDGPRPYRARTGEGGQDAKFAGGKSGGGKRFGGKPGGAERPARDRPSGDTPARHPRGEGDGGPRPFSKPVPRGKAGFAPKPGGVPKGRPAGKGPEAGKPRGPRKGPGRKD